MLGAAGGTARGEHGFSSGFCWNIICRETVLGPRGEATRCAFSACCGRAMLCGASWRGGEKGRQPSFVLVAFLFTVRQRTDTKRDGADHHSHLLTILRCDSCLAAAGQAIVWWWNLPSSPVCGQGVSALPAVGGGCTGLAAAVPGAAQSSEGVIPGGLCSCKS